MKPKTRRTASRKRSPKTLPTKPAPSKEKQTSLLPSPLSSINLAKLLSGFMTFRSTIKDLSHSIQRMENLMDSTYQMFEIASRMLSGSSPQERRNLLTLLPTPKGKQPEEDEEIPVIHLPFEEKRDSGSAGMPLGPLLQNIDFSQLLAIMQSPLFQNLISNLFRTNKSATVSTRTDLKRKQG